MKPHTPSSGFTGQTNPWVPMTVVMTATMMVVLDTTIVNVALHQIAPPEVAPESALAALE